MPHIVNTDWLIDCMFNGNYIDVEKEAEAKEKYSFDMSHFKLN